MISSDFLLSDYYQVISFCWKERTKTPLDGWIEDQGENGIAELSDGQKDDALIDMCLLKLEGKNQVIG